MKNNEKYAEQIVDIACKGESFGVEKCGLVEGVLLAPITRILVVLTYGFQWLNMYRP